MLNSDLSPEERARYEHLIHVAGLVRPTFFFDERGYVRERTPHTHREVVEGCFRCDLSRDEEPPC